MMKGRNPWLGLASYEEEMLTGLSPYQFCGRDREIDEVYSYVDNNILTTLYGKSGVGKSSLLQAGVFPRLRANNYLPVFVRLGLETDVDYYASIIVGRIHEELHKHGYTEERIESVEAIDDQSDDAFLWYFFHSHRFYGKNSQIVYPVVVIDQFEELFFNNRAKIDLLLRQIYLLVDDSSMDSAHVASANITNYRVLLAIREDDLYRLEDSIDRLRLVEMKYCRYRLTELTYEDACLVVSEPGIGLFHPAEVDKVVDIIVREAVGEDGEISTAVLSLLCSMFYDKTIGVGREKMSISAIKYFMEGSKGNYLASFYKEIKELLGDSKKWYYIEDELITDEGRRKSVLKSEFVKHVPDSDFLFRGRTGMLRYVTTSSRKEKSVEIIHDLLAKQLLNNRAERTLKKNADKLKVVIGVVLAVMIVLFSVIGSVRKKNESLMLAYKDMQMVQSRYLASEAHILLDKGSYDKALRLCLYALPKDLEDSDDRPYVEEAEIVMHQIEQARKGFRKIELDGYCLMAMFSDNGKEILVYDSYEGNPSFVLDALTGQAKKLTINDAFRVNSYFNHKTSPNGRYIRRQSVLYDKKYDLSSSDVFLFSKNVVFSNDSEYMLVNKSDEMKIFKLYENGAKVPIRIISKENNSFNTAVFHPSGKYILAASDDNFAYVYNWNSDVPVLKLRHDAAVTSAAFSPDGRTIITTSIDKTLRIWHFTPLQELLDTYHNDTRSWDLGREDKIRYHLQ